jgi:AcrR family transcriptional regulator
MASQRADFTRNERRILNAAARLLADAPGAGMGEIAAAAELGRATLYRHFPTREALIEGLRAEAFGAVAAIIEQHGVEPREQRLRSLVEDLFDAGERYRIVFAGALDERAREQLQRRLELPLRAVVEQAQAAGELDPEVPPLWVVVALEGALESALKARAAGRLGAAEAKRLAVRTLLRGFASPHPG